MSVIAYDQPVEDLISGLNSTGHITHGNYIKSGVTFHHNAGIFTHDELLNIWKTRAASAHFDIDAKGAVGQFALVEDYAWACANTTGNSTTISIEMCNSTLAPKWQVSPVTWKSAARLAAWLFAHKINQEPTSHNIYYHSDWYATACAGPYMDSIRSEVVSMVQAYYAGFVGGTTPAPAPSAELAIDGSAGPLTFARACEVAGVKTRKAMIKKVQTQLNAKGVHGYNGKKLAVDGVGLYSNTTAKTVKTNTCYALLYALGNSNNDGTFDKSPSSGVKMWQRSLNIGHLI